MRSALLILATLLPAGAQAQEVPTSVITTMGSRQASLPPSWAEVHLEVETRGSSASEASAENGLRQRRIMESMRRQGLSDTQVQLVSFMVRGNSDYETQKLLFYQASAAITIVVQPLDRLGLVIDSALAAGATEVSRIDFESDSAAVARERLLAEAVDAARRDALVLAKAAGGQLGLLLDVSTARCTVDRFGNVNVSEITVVGASSVRSSIADLTPGEVRVSVDVCTRWQLTR